MSDIWQHIISWLNCLNNYAGLLSLGALLAAIIVPVAIYRRNRKNELLRLKDRREAINKYQPYEYPLEIKDRLVASECLDKEIERG